MNGRRGGGEGRRGSGGCEGWQWLVCQRVCVLVHLVLLAAFYRMLSPSARSAPCTRPRARHARTREDVRVLRTRATLRCLHDSARS